jgi:hypothetical protein
MRLVTLGMVAVLLTAGCAVETVESTGEGDPSTRAPTTEVKSDVVPAIVTAPGNPGVQKWGPRVPTTPIEEDCTGCGKSNPDPSPWKGEANINPPTANNGSAGTGTNPSIRPVTTDGLERNPDQH